MISATSDTQKELVMDMSKDENHRINLISQKLDKILKKNTAHVNSVALNMDRIIPYLTKLSYSGQSAKYDLMKKKIILPSVQKRTNEDNVFNRFMKEPVTYSNILRTMHKQELVDGKLPLIRTVKDRTTELKDVVVPNGVDALNSLQELHNKSYHELMDELNKNASLFDTDSKKETNEKDGEDKLLDCNK
jgi:hypothetical protein